MTGFFKENKVLLALVLVTVIVAMTVIGTRMSIESNAKTYDVVLDYAELNALAEQSEHDISWWLKFYKDMGIDKVGLQEENVMTLMEDSSMPVNGEVMANFMENALWQDEVPAEFLAMINDKGFDKFDVLITAGNKKAADFIDGALKQRFHDDTYVAYLTDSEGYFLIDGTPDCTLYSEDYKFMNSVNGGFITRRDIAASKIMYITLGLDADKVKICKDAGMSIIPRTLAYQGFNDEKFGKGVLEEYAKYDIVPQYIIAGGDSVFGFDDGIDMAKDYILDNNITIGLIENTTQRQNILQHGVEEVAISSGYNTVRVFSVWNYIQYRYQYYGYAGAKEIENTLFRAITERNVRVIYFKPFLQNQDLHTYVTNPDDYTETFNNLNARLAKHGITLGTASTMREYEVSAFARIMVGIGAALASIVVLRSILPLGKKFTIALSVLAVLLVLAAFFVMPNTAVLIASFAAACVFACLGITFYTYMARHEQEKLAQDSSLVKIIAPAVLALLVSVIIGLIGGMMTATPLAATSFMLEIDIFRGVKLAQLLPIAYFAVAFLAFYGYGANKTKIGHLEWLDIKELLGLKISIWMCLLAAVVGGVGVYYIMRTGHESNVEVSSIEMLFRNTLEELLIARPRSKEFLFAFPCIMLMVYCSVRKLKLFTLVFGMGGVLGVTSVINTFMHIRTPLYLGFARTAYSTLFGLILGLIGMIIFDILYKIYVKYIEKYV